MEASASDEPGQHGTASMTAGTSLAVEGAPATLHLLRITIEAATLLSIATGDATVVERTARRRAGKPTAEQTSAAAILRDADGIPAIPGAAMQGALRRLYAEMRPDRDATALFGREDRNGEGTAGRLVFGWAHAHDSRDQCPRGLRREGIDADGYWSDPVLSLLARPHPLWRDHVALSARHAVDGARKFARTAVPSGTRFSLEIAGWGDAALATEMTAVAALFTHPRFRLGGASRRGYGRVRLIRASRCTPALGDAKTLRETRSTPASAPFPEPLAVTDLSERDDAATVLHLELTCPDLLRFGGETEECRPIAVETTGARSLRDGSDPSTLDADQRPDKTESTLTLLREPRIEYRNGVGTVLEQLAPAAAHRMRFPAPASSIKGALAHRTLYHANRAAGRTADVDALLKLPEDERKRRIDAMAERPPDLGAFLGTAKGPPLPDGSSGGGVAARMAIDDTEAADAAWVVAIDHVAIDRFAGGAREQDGLLFSEEALLGASLSIAITILPPPESVASADGVGGWPQATVAEPFLRALRDLCRKRLALGARSLGVCEGALTFKGRAADAWTAAASRIGLPIIDKAES